jgi:hypothetical protein
MKKLIANLALVFLTTGIFAQTAKEASLAQQATDKLVEMYKLDSKQSEEVLKIQERKFRNLAEFEPLKKTDPSKYVQKVRSMQQANDASFLRLLNRDQQLLFQQQQSDLRKKKSELFKELMDAGASQQAIEAKILQFELETML